MSDLHAQNREEWRSERDRSDHGRDRPDPSEYEDLEPDYDDQMEYEHPHHMGQQFMEYYRKHPA